MNGQDLARALGQGGWCSWTLRLCILLGAPCQVLSRGLIVQAPVGCHSEGETPLGSHLSSATPALQCNFYHRNG